MAKEVICPMCGAKFKTGRPNKKYCCFVCKEAGARLQRMKWKDENPDYYKDYMQQYRTERKG